jgi:hypothetical protein
MSPPAADAALFDPTRLGQHIRQCAFARGPLHRLRCVAEALDAFLAPRFVTTLALLTMVVVLVGASLPA